MEFLPIRSSFAKGWQWRMTNACCGRLSTELGALYRAAHNDVHESDERRCLLERHLRQRWQSQENDPEELTCAGLAYLERVLSEVPVSE